MITTRVLQQYHWVMHDSCIPVHCELVYEEFLYYRYVTDQNLHTITL